LPQNYFSVVPLRTQEYSEECAGARKRTTQKDWNRQSLWCLSAYILRECCSSRTR